NPSPSLIEEALADFPVGIDAAVTKEGPAVAGACHLTEIRLHDQHALLVCRCACENAAVGCNHEALPPEFDTPVARRARFEADTVDGNDEAAVRDRLRPLHRLPGLMLSVAHFRFLLGMPPDGGGIEKDLRSPHRSEPCRFRVPLVPADQYAEFRSFGAETLEAQVAGREIVLLVVARIVRDVHLPVLADI